MRVNKRHETFHAHVEPQPRGETAICLFTSEKRRVVIRGFETVLAMKTAHGL